jgi:uncharacterized protein YidB (DUF937 family)
LIDQQILRGNIMGLLDSVLGGLMGGGQQGGGSNPLLQIAMQMLMKQGGGAGAGGGLAGMLGGAGGGGGGLGGLAGMLGGGAPAQANAQGGHVDVGGLGGIIDSFQKSGLGHITDSWVGGGDNLPVSGDQVTQALGHDKISQIANQLGMPHGDVAGGLAQMLPGLINHVTPNGQVPEDHSMIGDALSMLFKK